MKRKFESSVNVLVKENENLAEKAKTKDENRHNCEVQCLQEQGQRKEKTIQETSLDIKKL